MNIRLSLLFTIILYTFFGYAQTGITVGPPRLFFVSNAGENQIQTVDVTNPSKDYTLDLSVSLEDWRYTLYGDNEMAPIGTFTNSGASWISISEPFFSLKPGETKRLNVNLAVPQTVSYTDSVPVHTSMLFVTQLNPRQGVDKEGANIKIAVRSGIKIYHRFNGKDKADLEITNLKHMHVDSVGDFLELAFDVTGNIWMEGKVRAEFINQETGQKIVLDNMAFYCLPGDKRKQYIQVPKELTKGNYLVSVMLFYGEEDMVKAAELEFDYDPAE
ncbi:hypothetical protein FAZ15_10320 [Sphingobacterium olei]|uniref:Molecular chaperone n=1 Tax=Sphingobacterium olei TaxID=2571155 RepID=A0A4U0NZX1_9SPHI|nr:hypothetical protein [Sphingobacterium olei]TJZ60393.1 hypothetical protein FAZ15_10320 [Sphingobacterium olei]